MSDQMSKEDMVKEAVEEAKAKTAGEEETGTDQMRQQRKQEILLKMKLLSLIRTVRRKLRTVSYTHLTLPTKSLV